MTQHMAQTRYTQDHEYIRIEGDVGIVGITAHAQDQLGDVVHVELPQAGKTLAKGDEAAVVESVKAAAEIYAPVSGEVVDANTALAKDPALVNRDPEAEGWFLKIRLAEPDELSELMDRAAYDAYVAGMA